MASTISARRRLDRLPDAITISATVGARPGACAQARLDRAVDEARPAVGEVGAGQQHPPLGAAHLGVVVAVPAGTVDRPGALRELVGEPVVGGRIQYLVSGNDAVEGLLHPSQVGGVALGCIQPESDHDLGAVVAQDLAVEIAELVARPDRVLTDPRPAGADEDLDAAGGLAQRDPGGLPGDSPGSNEIAPRVLSGTATTTARAVRISPERGVHLDRRRGLSDRGDRRLEPGLVLGAAGDRP